MRTLLYLILGASVFGAVLFSLSGPSDKEIDLKQDALCVKWGARRASSDYIHCRATLAARQANEDDSAATGIALGMMMGAAANSSARR